MLSRNCWRLKSNMWIFYHLYAMGKSWFSYTLLKCTIECSLVSFCNILKYGNFANLLLTIHVVFMYWFTVQDIPANLPVLPAAYTTQIRVGISTRSLLRRFSAMVSLIALVNDNHTKIGSMVTTCRIGKYGFFGRRRPSKVWHHLLMVPMYVKQCQNQRTSKKWPYGSLIEEPLKVTMLDIF